MLRIVRTSNRAAVLTRESTLPEHRAAERPPGHGQVAHAGQAGERIGRDRSGEIDLEPLQRAILERRDRLDRDERVRRG